MGTLTFDCRTVTPMFLGGADGQEPELRVPSIKGMMRFWWRASSMLADKDAMLDQEGRIFGTSKTAIGRSKITMMINDWSLRDKEKIKYPMLPHKPVKRERANTGAVAEGTEFTIRVSCSNGDILSLAERVLSVSLLLGGIGKRSRRGFGSIMLNEWNFNNTDEVLAFAGQILGNGYRIDNGKIKRNSATEPPFPYIKEISIGNGYDDYNDVLTHIGEETHNHCNNALGCASGDSRMASPVYVSTIKAGNIYYPIITKLNSAFPRPIIDHETIQDNFIGAL
jgi:CRISPR-associated protein Cmr1